VLNVSVGAINRGAHPKKLASHPQATGTESLFFSLILFRFLDGKGLAVPGGQDLYFVPNRQIFV
jgi:hypothetical protein